MNRLTYVKLDPQNEKHCIEFEQLMRLYAKELDSHNNRETPDEVIAKWIDSIIKMQGDYDRHLKLCYDNETLIGFLYGKIDKPEHKGYKKIGYGYIMEFFVLLEYRRKGYGREMFYHLQTVFANDGASRMYLTADGVTGKPFWRSLGFVATGELSPENSQMIYEKTICLASNVNIKLLRYPSDSVLKAITKRYGDNSFEREVGITDTITSLHYKSDFFCVIAVDNFDNVIGSANFFQNSQARQEWLYADLWVDIGYRRQGIATKIVNAGIEHLSQMNAQTLKCTVSPDNIASLNLQRKVGFSKTILKPFEDFDLCGQIMFQIQLEHDINLIELSDRYDHLIFICDLMKDANNISDNEYQRLYKETRDALILNNKSRQHNHIVRKGIVPIGFTKINITNYNDELPETILMIHPKYKNMEKYVSKYLEQYKFL
ncbi:MAG: GNAT family N-acetyltransferase [Clostridia bacterium]|nr:GNAT family N-acetyltransferase [Clostridia bacterium]